MKVLVIPDIHLKDWMFDKYLLLDVRSKNETDFVTGVDMKISNYLKDELSKLVPQVGFMSEEDTDGIAPTRWILDPIDGTTNLIFDCKLSSVSLALCENEVITFGVIYNPYSEETIVVKKAKV